MRSVDAETPLTTPTQTRAVTGQRPAEQKRAAAEAHRPEQRDQSRVEPGLGELRAVRGRGYRCAGLGWSLGDDGAFRHPTLLRWRASLSMGCSGAGAGAPWETTGAGGTAAGGATVGPGGDGWPAGGVEGCGFGFSWPPLPSLIVVVVLVALVLVLVLACCGVVGAERAPRRAMPSRWML